MSRATHVATPGTEVGRDRRVRLELEVIESLRVAPGRIQLDIRQSMFTNDTSRPAGAWWIVDQSLDRSLRAAYNVAPAPPLLANLVPATPERTPPRSRSSVGIRVLPCAPGLAGADP